MMSDAREEVGSTRREGDNKTIEVTREPPTAAEYEILESHRRLD